MAMASRRKEPPKRPVSPMASFSPPLLALFFVLLFFVAFKVDDNGESEKLRGIFVLSVMLLSGVN